MQVADRVSFQEMDYTRLAFPDKHFDAVFTMESLVHAYDVRRTLSEFHRVVKPGGRVAFFEYSIAPDDQLKDYVRTLPPRLQRLRDRFGDPDDWVINHSAMLALREMRHGRLPTMLDEIGFIDIQEDDITRHVQPSLMRLHRSLRRLYPFARLFGAYSAFVNTTVAAEAFPLVANADLFHYNITTARRAGG